jgi:hypothetical protein
MSDKEIDLKGGWRLQAMAKMGRTEWATAIWFDTKLNTCLLTLKPEITKSEPIEIGKLMSVTIWL